MTITTKTIAASPLFTKAVKTFGAVGSHDANGVSLKVQAITDCRALFDDVKGKTGFKPIMFTGSESPIRTGLTAAYKASATEAASNAVTGGKKAPTAASVDRIVRDLIKCAIETRGFKTSRDLYREKAAVKAKAAKTQGSDSPDSLIGSGDIVTGAPTGAPDASNDKEAQESLGAPSRVETLKGAAFNVSRLAGMALNDDRPTVKQVEQLERSLIAALEIVAGCQLTD